MRSPAAKPPNLRPGGCQLAGLPLPGSYVVDAAPLAQGGCHRAKGSVDVPDQAHKNPFDDQLVR